MKIKKGQNVKVTLKPVVLEGVVESLDNVCFYLSQSDELTGTVIKELRYDDVEKLEDVIVKKGLKKGFTVSLMTCEPTDKKTQEYIKVNDIFTKKTGEDCGFDVIEYQHIKKEILDEMICKFWGTDDEDRNNIVAIKRGKK